MTTTDLPTHAYGGFWIRLGASILDALIFSLLEAPILLLAYGPEYYDFSKTGVFIQGWVDAIVTWVLPAIATMLFWRYKRATPAKMLLKLEVVDADTGETATVGQCILRYVGYFLAALPCGAGLLWVAFDPRKQGLHDRLANTVVRRRVTVSSSTAPRPAP